MSLDIKAKNVFIKVIETANASSLVVSPDNVEKSVTVVKELFAGTNTGVSVIKMTAIECQMCYEQNDWTAILSIGKYMFTLYFFMAVNKIFYTCHYSPS